MIVASNSATDKVFLSTTTTIVSWVGCIILGIIAGVTVTILTWMTCTITRKKRETADKPQVTFDDQ